MSTLQAGSPLVSRRYALGPQEPTFRGRAGRLLAGVLCLALMAIGLGAVTAPSAQAVTGATFDDGTHTWTFNTFGTPEIAEIAECAMTSDLTQPCSGAITIPSSVTDGSAWYTVTEIAVSEMGSPVVFAGNTSITSVVIPDTVTSIGAWSFYGATELTSVTFGTGVTSIGDHAFSGNTALTSATIPAGVTTMSDSVFSGDTSLTSVTLPAGLTTIDWNAFRDSGLTSVTIPNSVTTINPNAFMDAFRLASVTFGSGLTSVDSSAFSCFVCAVPYPVTSVVFAPGTTSFDASWVSGMSSLTSVSIPSSVTAIPVDAFNGKPLTTVTLPTGLVSIGARAFIGTSLPSVQIPSTVTSIGDNAFAFSFLLSSITFAGAPPATVGTDIFLVVPATEILVPRGAGWPAPPAPFDGIPTEYAPTPAPPAPPAPPDPAPAPVVTSNPSPSPTPTPTVAAIAAPVEGLAPVTAAVGGEVPPGAVRPGGSMLLVGGQPAPVVVAPAAGPKPTAVVATGPGFTASFGGVADDGAPLALGASGALVVQSVQQGRSGTLLRSGAAALSAVRRAQAATGAGTSLGAPVVAASGDGFLPGSTIRFYVLPGTLMGDLAADAAGAFAGNVPVPAGIVPGARTLQMNGYAPDGSVRSLSIGILVTPAGVEAAVSRKRASVFFEPMSARITARGWAVLRDLVQATGSAPAVTRVVGFVRATGVTGNDDSLSTARAAAVKAALRSLGLRGPIEDRGDGAAIQSGPAARRATVTIAYRRRLPRLQRVDRDGR